MRETGVPAALARAPMRAARPQHMRGRWAQPAKEFTRLRRRGVVRRLAHGYYIAPPEGVLADAWKPDLETAAMAVATARFGDRVPVLMGLGAARFHRALPRAIGQTFVAVPEQARELTLDDGVGLVTFVTRDTAAIDARLEQFETGRALVATPEQTVLDVAHRHDWGGGAALANEIITALWPRVDRERLDAIAHRQGRLLARNRAVDVAEHGRELPWR